MTKVAFVITNNRAGGVTKVIDLLGINPVKGKKITLKPNFNSADPAPGSTHNDTLSSLISKLRGLGSKDIVLAERSGPPDTRTVMQQKGIFELAKKMGFDIVILNEMGADGWVHLVPKDSHWKQGFHFARPYLDAECIVETCCLKTHAYGGHFTLSLKLAVGTVGRQGFPYMNELHSSPYQRLMIAEINSVFNPALIVVDGVEAFTEGGPAVGKRVRANVVLAGVDRIAVDAVGVAILRGLGTTPEVSRGKVFQQEQIARAVELGLGVDSPAGIEIVTGDDESASYAARIRRVLDAG